MIKNKQKAWITWISKEFFTNSKEVILFPFVFFAMTGVIITVKKSRIVLTTNYLPFIATTSYTNYLKLIVVSTALVIARRKGAGHHVKGWFASRFWFTNRIDSGSASERVSANQWGARERCSEQKDRRPRRPGSFLHSLFSLHTYYYTTVPDTDNGYTAFARTG